MFQFLDEQDDTPLFQALDEKGEGRLHQQAVAKAWANTEFGRSLCSMGGKLSGPALGEWTKLMSKVNPEWTLQNAKNGRAHLQEKLDSDPEFYADWIDNKSKGALKFKEEYPELFDAYQKLRVDGAMQWRLDNPEEHEINQKNWQEAGQKAAWEKEVWKDSILIAQGAWRAFLLTPEGDAWKLKQSDRMKLKRKDPVFNAKMKKAHDESEALLASRRESIKAAIKATSKKVICPRCNKSGAYRVMKRHHFDNCTFDKAKEIRSINSLDNIVYKNKNTFIELFTKEFDKSYFCKYNVYERYFVKLYPNKKTSGLSVKITFDKDSYFKSLELKEIERKAKVLEGQRERQRAMAEKRKGSVQTKKNKEASAVKVTCPHCQKEGSASGMKSWHFDYCKENPNRKIRVREPKIIAK